MGHHPSDLVISADLHGNPYIFDPVAKRRLRPDELAALVLDLLQHGHLGVSLCEMEGEQYEVRIGGEPIGMVLHDTDDGSWAAEYDGKRVVGFSTVGGAARRIVDRMWFDSTYETSRLTRLFVYPEGA
jgi:hypothetical protein